MKSWCKVASNLDSHPRIRRAGRAGREVFLFALRRNAEPDNPVSGRLPDVMLDPWYLADQLMMSEEEAVTGVTACRHAGLLVQDGESWLICGWEEDWGKTAVPGKERTAKWRQSSKIANPVTDGDARDVTSSLESHGDARDVLDKTRGEEKRPDEKREESATPPAGGSSVPVKPKPDRAAKIPMRAWPAADFFRDLLLAEQPTSALARKPWSDEKGLRLEWADSLRKLVECDGRTWEEIGETLIWLFRKQPAGKHRFVVQSPDSLREKWDRIHANRTNRQGAVGGDDDPLLRIARGLDP